MQGNLGQAEASIAGGPAGNTSMLPEKKEIEEKEGLQYSKIWKKYVFSWTAPCSAFFVQNGSNFFARLTHFSHNSLLHYSSPF